MLVLKGLQGLRSQEIKWRCSENARSSASNLPRYSADKYGSLRINSHVYTVASAIYVLTRNFFSGKKRVVTKLTKSVCNRPVCNILSRRSIRRWTKEQRKLGNLNVLAKSYSAGYRYDPFRAYKELSRRKNAFLSFYEWSSIFDKIRNSNAFHAKHSKISVPSRCISTAA